MLFDIYVLYENDTSVVNFLDVNVILIYGLYYPFHKPDKSIHYNYAISNHSQSVIDVFKSIDKNVAIIG